MDPILQWEYSTDGDWQPFTESTSACLEAAYRAWQEGGPPTAQVITGAVGHAVDFETMTRQSPHNLLPPGMVRRQEFFGAASVAVLRIEVERLRETNQRLSEELAAQLGDGPRPVTSGSRPSRPPESHDNLRLTTNTFGTRPSPGTTAGHSWRTADSDSGMISISVGSLESIAEFIFALKVQATDQSKRYDRTILLPGDPRRRWLEDYFMSSLQAHRVTFGSDEWCAAPDIEIMKICEVVNQSANSCYLRELMHMRGARPGGCVLPPELEPTIRGRTDTTGPRLNEVLLFHGCRWETVFSILREGFDSRLGGTNVGAAFGIGAYFSTCASKADQYTQRWGDWDRAPRGPATEIPPQLRCLLIARVALGEIHEQRTPDSTLRRPPLGPDGSRYDSVMGVPRRRGGCVDYDEFIVYKSAQATPQFLVEYEHLPSCRCCFCSGRHG